jgi:bifunctional non-homologous end joining protein LigD
MPARRTLPARAALPRYEPQLATLVKAAPDGDEWLHELKYDGYRIGCRLEDGEVELFSRRGKDWTGQFPELVAAARALRARQALLDGEVAVLMADGRTSFQALQNYFGGQNRDRKGLVYFAFDVLHLDGEDLAAQPLDARKEALARLIRESPAKAREVIRFSEHVVGNGAAFFAQACKLGIEGIVSKQRAQPYRKGRNTCWVKTKCMQRQELVIGGFTDPEGSRAGLGALLVGVNDASGRLTFAGKVGTGFTQKGAGDLRRRLDAIEVKACPFHPAPTGPERHAHWVRPTLVAEVSFAEWTGDGKVRHASFQGLRADKTAKEVVAEMPAETPKVAAAAAAVAAKPAKPAKTAASAKPGRVDVAGVSISNPGRTLYPAAGISKLDLARYYQSIADWILPHVVGRPLTLVRCPKGLTGAPDACFYMKHSNVWAPPALRRVHIKERTKRGEYLVIEDIAGVISLVQMDILEIHGWNSLADDVEHPNRVVFDLDPGPEVRWPEVVEAARLVRKSLETLELESWVKNTGGNGLHVVVPLAPGPARGPSWEDCFEFTRLLALAIVRSHPAKYTIDIPKAGREKKILIDYLRNNRGNTSVAAFSSRARETAPVSVPLTWEELSPKIPANHFTVATLPARLARLRRDPWQGYWKCQQELTPDTIAALARLR